MGLRKKPGNKTVPYLSQEFLIQNHGDIATCICMVFIIGLMFQVIIFYSLKLCLLLYVKFKTQIIQVTSPLASAFIAPRHNITEIDYTSDSPILYTYGFKDLCLVFFYTITAVIFHAIIQEYVLDVTIFEFELTNSQLIKQ